MFFVSSVFQAYEGLPGRASRVRWLGVVEFGENADFMLDVIKQLLFLS